MSYAYDSGWIRRDNGSTLTWNGAGRYVKSATVRFKGVGLYQTSWSSWSYNSGSGSGSLSTSHSYPSPPSGYSYLSSEAQLGYRNTSGSSQSCSWRIGHWTSPIASGSHTAVHNTQYTRNGSRSSQVSSESFTYSQSGSFTWAVGTRTRGERTLGTTNPALTVNNQAASHSGTLSPGSFSPTYNINGLLNGNGDGKSNTMTFSSSGSGRCEVRVIIEWATDPEVVTNQPSNIGPYSVTLNGSLTDWGNNPTSVYFYYRVKGTGAYNEHWVAERTSTGSFTANIYGLEINTEYQFYARAWNWFGESIGNVVEFTTITTLPNVNSGETSQIGYTQANIDAVLDNDGGLDTDLYFEYGKTTSYELGVVSKGSHRHVHWFGELLTGLEFDTTYRWRAYGINAVGRNNGSARQFTTLYPYLPVPSDRIPLANARFEEGQITFEFTLDGYAPNPATKYHVRIRFSSFVGMDPTLFNYETKSSQAGWEYQSGENWLAFPAGGVDPNTRVRFATPVGSDLPLGPTYWDTSSWDGLRYGNNSPVRAVRVLIDVEELYTLLINDVPFKFVEKMEIVEASNGEIGKIGFSVSNHEGEGDSIEFGDSVIVALRDHEGTVAEYAGRIRHKETVGFVTHLVAILGDGFFGERIVGQDYSTQEIGTTIAHIVNNYVSPLSSLGVDLSTGYVAPVKSLNETVTKVFEELRKNYGLFYFVDRDNEVQFYKKENVQASVRTLRSGSGEFDIFPPIVKAYPATEVTATTAVLNGGLIETGGSGASVYFYWREKGAVEWNDQWVSEENAPADFSYSLSLLTADTTYEFYVRGWNESHNSYSDTLEFTTLEE